ncbi:MAG TPA: LacI family transcriptional regulator, partial [Lentisphaeria bacterium]|nr:LacI family transcriptional regulator [Lentisphaeria bacterium]
MVLTNATIRQVAERAKVSTATVSRILNGKSGHRAATVESVRRIVSEIDREASQAA